MERLTYTVTEGGSSCLGISRGSRPTTTCERARFRRSRSAAASSIPRRALDALLDA